MLCLCHSSRQWAGPTVGARFEPEIERGWVLECEMKLDDALIIERTEQLSLPLYAVDLAEDNNTAETPHISF